MIVPPDYLDDKVMPAAGTSPANLLKDGEWCGHGEAEYGVFDVQAGKENTFFLQLPDLDHDMDEITAPVVMVHSDTGITFPIYDTRKHPASLFYPEEGDNEYEPSPLQPALRCPNCNHHKFRISVGFEIPADPMGPNDTTWFALAAKCVECGWQEIVYDDETA